MQSEPSRLLEHQFSWPCVIRRPWQAWASARAPLVREKCPCVVQVARLASIAPPPCLLLQVQVAACDRLLVLGDGPHLLKRTHCPAELRVLLPKIIEHGVARAARRIFHRRHILRRALQNKTGSIRQSHLIVGDRQHRLCSLARHMIRFHLQELVLVSIAILCNVPVIGTRKALTGLLGVCYLVAIARWSSDLLVGTWIAVPIVSSAEVRPCVLVSILVLV